MNMPAAAARNPGPDWGFAFLSWAERSWPKWLFRTGLAIGTWVGLARMSAARAHSRAYLTVVLGRPPGLVAQWRHFFAFTEVLILKYRAARGAALRCLLEAENAAAFETLVQSDQPALFGSFHFGASDLLGYMLGERGRRVSILRLKLGNSADTRLLGQRFAEHISFLWVNDPANMLFDLKAALDAGQSLALKCDRFEFSSKLEPFHFLGAQRLFPFTIYHLALLFDRPVVFCVAVSGQPSEELRVYSSPVFTPDATLGRAANLAAARAHFQAVVTQLEGLVRQYPMLWFNFLPLNPEAPALPSLDRAEPNHNRPTSLPACAASRPVTGAV
jgi:predicted LPLAT superfamily acyltransferase